MFVNGLHPVGATLPSGKKYPSVSYIIITFCNTQYCNDSLDVSIQLRRNYLAHCRQAINNPFQTA